MVGLFLAAKWPIMVPFCGLDHQKSIVLLISDTLSVGGCWGQPMLLFWKLVDETQMGSPCDHAVRDISSKLSIFLPLRAIYFRSYRYETPCNWAKLIYFSLVLREREEKETKYFAPRGSSCCPMGNFSTIWVTVRPLSSVEIVTVYSSSCVIILSKATLKKKKKYILLY